MNSTSDPTPLGDSHARPGRPYWRRLADPLRILIVAVLTVGFGLGCGPIGPISGGRLSGDERGAPDDWMQFVGIENAQIETNPSAPHSINIWFVIVDGDAFVASSLLMGPTEPEQREWVMNVVADPRVRFRLDGVVFPARLDVVEDDGLRARIVERYIEKYPKLDATRGDAARFYRVVAQGGTS